MNIPADMNDPPRLIGSDVADEVIEQTRATAREMIAHTRKTADEMIDHARSWVFKVYWLGVITGLAVGLMLGR